MTAKFIHVRKPEAAAKRDWPIATLCGHFAGPMNLGNELYATCPKCKAVAVTLPGPRLGDHVTVSPEYALNEARRPIEGRVFDITNDRQHVAIVPHADQDIPFCSGNWVPVTALVKEAP